MRLRSSGASLLVPVAMLLANPASAAPTAASNPMRWEGHEAQLNNAVAWQQKDKDGRWVTFVLLTDKPIPAAMLADTNALDPEVLSQDAQLAKKAGAQGLLFSVSTGGILTPEGPTTQQKFHAWFHDGGKIGESNVSGAGGIDIESLTAERIKGRTVAGIPADKDHYWSVAFDVPILHGDAAKMAAAGQALGKDGGQPGKDLAAYLDAVRKKDFAGINAYAAPEMAKYLKEANPRDKALAMIQSMAGDGQQIVNGLRTGDKAKLYWVKKSKDPKQRNQRCTDEMVLLEGKWRSTQSACAAE